MGNNEYAITQQIVTLEEYMKLIAEHKLPLLIRLSKQEREKFVFRYKAFAYKLDWYKKQLHDLENEINDILRLSDDIDLLTSTKEIIQEISKDVDGCFDLTTTVGIGQFYKLETQKRDDKRGAHLVLSFKDIINSDIVTLTQLEMQNGTIYEIDATEDKGLLGIYFKVIPTVLECNNRAISTERLIRELRTQGNMQNKFIGKK